MLADFSALLTGRGFVPRTILRKGSGVLYFKASEQIEDMLTFMGAQNAALEIMNLKVYKDFRNNANRLTNCETANIGKTASASAQTLYAIQLLRRHGALARTARGAAAGGGHSGGIPHRAAERACGAFSVPYQQIRPFAPHEKAGGAGSRTGGGKPWQLNTGSLPICIFTQNTAF